MLQGNFKGGCCFNDVIELSDMQITEQANKVLDYNDIMIAIFRHSYHDWGLAPDELWELNDSNFKAKKRVASCFEDSNGVLFTVATDFGKVNHTVIALVEEIEE